MREFPALLLLAGSQDLWSHHGEINPSEWPGQPQGYHGLCLFNPVHCGYSVCGNLLEEQQPAACCLFTVSNMAYQSNSKKSHPSRQILAHSDRWTHHKHLFILLSFTDAYSTVDTWVDFGAVPGPETPEVPALRTSTSLCPTRLFLLFNSNFSEKARGSAVKSECSGPCQQGSVLIVPSCLARTDAQSCMLHHVPHVCSHLAFSCHHPRKKKIVNEHVPPGTSSTARC